MRLPLALLALAALAAAGGEAAQTGRFSTPEQHRCRWELRSAAGASELRLSCRAPAGGGARSCAYRGEPQRCPAYGARSRRYWRQVLARLRRQQQHPCSPGGPLSPRLCGPDRAPPEAQLRLLPSPGPGTEPGSSSPAPTAGPTGDPAGTFCAERWHSLCSFFVGFWEG